ncbi:hypothetical protein Hrd1104_00405 [Halorhabdus sp. CBA1104]|uniref:helix-turn-helix transcriptional regulator n=1 Tax=Halorhabdus sp. CBA1104 TaxID=1380432 RepID=UPI0012B26D7A|nr:hypothetical protein [Halorhabdus sp. CBA1104]QGN05902.1 hypothetical protein Hrd1104_00405 [Halorhabdus sp. CBA1104]
MAPLFRVAALALGVVIVLQVGIAAGAPVSSTNGYAVADGAVDGNTTMTIALQADGDARWNVTMSVSLEDPMAIESFRQTGKAFEAGDSDVLSIETFRQFGALASQATDREMALDNVTRTASVDNGTGQLALSFTWRNFGRAEGTYLYVDDVFESPTGTWLDGLAANQQLLIEAPDSFEITSAPKGFTNKTIRWAGPTAFEPSYLSITYRFDATTNTPTVTETTAGSVDSDGSIGPVPIVLFLLIVGGGSIYVFRRGEFPASDGSDTAADSSSATNDEQALEAPAQEPTDAPADGPDEQPADDTDDGTDAGSPPDRELLSDEEYVEALLEHNGGRMKQAAIVSETDWSNAKVSQLLSSMADDDRVEKLRIGRENLISLPEFENEE